MFWQDQVDDDVKNWLLEDATPGVRYLTLRDLIDLPPDDPAVVDACRAAHAQGAIADIVAVMEDEGYWQKPGPGYDPRYRSSVWSIILLAQLGASSKHDERILRACEYLLDQSLTSNGQFTRSGAPSTTLDCLQGNLCAALLDLGINDPRLDKAFEWLARSVTGEGVAGVADPQADLRFYQSSNCGPGFACAYNNTRPCAWGAVKVMLAFSKWPEPRRTPPMDRAIQAGVDFLFSADPATAGYPTKDDKKPSRNWWKLGFPVFYVTDLLQNIEALVRLGYGDDPRLANALDLIREKRNAQGSWNLEYDYTGKTWVNFGEKNQPNKWVTLRALRVLKAVA